MALSPQEILEYERKFKELEQQELRKIEEKFKQLELKEKKSPNTQKLNKIRTDILSVKISDAIISKLLSHQVEHLQNLIYALRRHGAALDSSDTGTGKTYSAAAVCAQMGLSPIIICPKPVIPTWYKVCDYYGVVPLAVVNYETWRNGKYYLSLTEFRNEERAKCPYIEYVREEVEDPISGTVYTKLTKIKWKLPTNSIVIFDEAHKGKNGMLNSNPSFNSRMMASIREYYSIQDRKFILFLSATITDKLQNFDVYAYVFKMYQPRLPKIYKRFVRKLGSNPVKRVHQLLFPHRGSRMNIKEIKKNTGDAIFRKNDVKAKLYPVDKDTADAIEEQHREIQEAMAQLRRKEISSECYLAVLIYARQQMEILKVPTFVKKARKYLNQGLSVVIFVNFNDTMKKITEHLLGDVENTEPIIEIHEIDYIRGGQSSEEREDIIQEFRDDNLKLLMCNIKAGGVAISLHDVNGDRQRSSIISPTWSPIDLKQCLGRIYRADAKSDAIQRIVYCAEKNEQDSRNETSFSVEEMICENVDAKLRMMSTLNDGDLSSYVQMHDSKPKGKKKKVVKRPNH